MPVAENITTINKLAAVAVAAAAAAALIEVEDMTRVGTTEITEIVMVATIIIETGIVIETETETETETTGSIEIVSTRVAARETDVSIPLVQ
jgi:hypothetical protein